MKLSQATNVIERSERFEESNFTIEATAKTFMVLSDTLYSNKIKAVIRELSTNAYDSHIDNGNPNVPFDVHLPNSMEPTFSIRDYGTGLSHEDCTSLYTTYFKSNRTNTNEATGCFGLGSKSPFAYNDSFTVESFFNGMHRTYSAYKNEREEPVFALMSEKETEEQNGLKISFPVKSGSYDNDFDDFQEYAEEVYQYFKVKPSVSGAELNIGELEKTIHHEGEWAFYKGGRRTTGESIAIMGQVAYPIDSDIFSDLEDKTIAKLIMSPILMDFKIGELDVTPSRESLSYNEYTKKSIIKKVEDIVEGVKDVIQTEFQDCKDLWDARKLYVSMYKQYKFLSNMTDIDSFLEWNGQPLFDQKMGLVVMLPESNEHHSPSVKCLSRQYYRTAVESNVATKIYMEQEFDIYVDDLGRGAVGRCKAEVHRMVNTVGNGHTIYLIKGSDPELETIANKLGCDVDDFKLASDLSKPVYTRDGNSSYSVSRTSVAVFNEEHSQWDDTSIDITEGGIYVEIYRYEPQFRFVSDSNSSLRRLLNELEVLGYPIKKKIYGMKKTILRQKRFMNSNWVKLEDIAHKVFDRVKKDKSLIRDFWINKDKESLKGYGNTAHIEGLQGIAKHLKTTNIISKYVNLYNSVEDEEKAQRIQAFTRLHTTFNERVEEDPNYTNVFENADEKIESRYPMLEMVGRMSYLEDEEYQVLAQYVDLVELTKGKV